MTVRELLADLEARSIQVRPEGAHLRFRAPRGALSAEHRSLLAAHKAEVLEILRDVYAASRVSRPLSHNQLAVWVAQALAPHSSNYHIGFAVRMRSELDVAALRVSCQGLVDRHAVLRTTYRVEHGEPVQEIHGHLPVDFAQIYAAESDADTMLARMVTEHRRPFDLERGPVFRVRLFTSASDEHVLLVSIHHIAADGWSAWMLLDELRTLYRAQHSGSASTLPIAVAEYVDFVRWQRDLLEAPDAERLWSYWQAQCASAPAVLELPTDRPRAVTGGDEGASCLRTIAPGLAERLRALAKSEGTTLFTVLLAAFEVLLHRYTQQDEIVVGSPSFGRSHSGFDKVVGHFVNMLPLRGNLSGNPTFRSFLHQVRSVVLGALTHQDYPFTLIVERLGRPRDVSRFPVFQVAFQLQQAQQSVDKTALFDGDLLLEPMPLPQQDGQFDLTLDVTELGRALHTTFKYRTDLFDASTIARMHGHLETLLTSIVENPDEQVSDLALLTDVERQQLVDWNRTAAPYPLDRCLHDLVAAQVYRTPDRVALEFDGQHLTYRQLDARATQLAHLLASCGAGPDVLVGVCMERSLEMVVALLGILKAGAAYVPLDPSYPPDRLAFMTDDAQIPLLLTQPHLAPTLPPSPAAVIALDPAFTALADQPVTPLPTPVTSEHLAYVIYTSGSTGRPKGAMNTHRAIVNRLLWMQDAYPLTGDDRVLQKTPFSFDVSVWEFFWPLLVGARLVIARPNGHKDTSYLVDVITRCGITTLHFVPSMLEVFLDNPAASGCTSLRRVFASGEALPPELVERFFSRLPAELHNLYGPTEAAVDVTAWACSPAAGARSTIPIGRPIANITIHILDPHGQPVPVGVPGELHIGGVGLARGYLRRPDLTADKFIPDPFSPLPGARLYRSGDLARYRPDGDIEYLGRLDHQVKLRGFRIELGEIEAALAEHPAIRHAVVLARELAPGDRRLVAYVVPNSLPSLPPDAAGERLPLDELARDLRDRLRQRLPDYMLPSHIVPLPALPLSPNGKVDRRALPAPPTSPTGQRSTVAPRTSTEQILAILWAEILGMDSVGIDDDFFDLGGHSLLAIRLMARIEERLGVKLELRSLFEAPTVAALAAVVDNTRTATDLGDPEPALRPLARTEPVPLSFGQERLWFLDHLTPGQATYNVPALIELRGSLNIPALSRSLEQIVARHDVLRTTFAIVDGHPVQVVAPPRPLDLRLVDLQAVPDAQQRRRAQQLAQVEVLTPFDLAHGPLFRATLLTLGPEEHWLLLIAHHSVTDAWSIGVLIRDLAAYYQAALTGQPAALPELPVQYADYAAWQRAWLEGDRLEAQLAYWRDRLRGPLPVLDLPTDRPRPALQTTRGGFETTWLPPELVTSLEKLGNQSRSTLFMTLLTGFTVVLGRYTGQDDLLVGVPIAGRTRPEVEPLVGFFVNTLALRTDLSDAPPVCDLLARVRQTALEAFAHQDLPFEKLVEELKPERDLSRSPLFQVMFNFLDRAPDLPLPGLAARLATIDLLAAMDRIETKFDLTLNAWRDGGRLGLLLEYNADLFDPDTARRLLHHLRVVLEAMVATPEQSIATLPLLTPQERQQILVDWNRTATPYSLDRCLHDLVAAQVHRSPDRVALEFDSQHLTYRQLDARATQLAHLLASRGAGPDVLVGVCMERSLEMVVALLGILKAGAAYVPLDPSYPPDRLAFMTDDAQISLLLTQPHLAPTLPPSPAAVIALDPAFTALADQPVTPLPTPVTSEHLAYVIYTSGSTGRPKGVAVPHRSVVNFLTSMQRTPGLTADDVLLAVTTLSFDIAGLELFLPLIAGARVVIASRQVASDGAALAQALHTAGATVMQATPATWQMLVETGWRGHPTLKILCGGEALSPALADALCARAPEVWNLYGPTETTIWSTVHRVLPPVGGPLPIGRPIANTTIHILDPHGQPVPVGVPGELHIGGVGLARGYLRRPDLTADKFIPDPFSPLPGARLYRTGDLARYRPDADIEYLGRLDHQVKLRGFRIELGEIEAALAEHPAIRQAVTLAREVASGDRRLVAYVVLNEAGHDPGLLDALRGHLRRRLPEYMVPATVTVLDALPLTANGKVERKRLPSPTVVRPSVATEPETPLERSIVEVWREVLGRPEIGLDDNFFDVGGHSLLAVRMLAALEQVCGERLPVSTLFADATIRHLVSAIREKREHLLLTPLQPDGNRPPFFFLYGEWAGGGFYSRQLARTAGPEQPFYVFHPWGLDGGAIPPTIEQMAEEYLKALRAFRPAGPYLLGGYCIGGMVAFEMARRLHEQGENVDLLLTIDTGAWNTRLRGLRALSRTLGRVFRMPAPAEQRFFLTLRSAVVSTVTTWHMCRKNPVETLQRAYRRLRGIRSPRTVASPLDRQYLDAVRSYVPESYPGRVTLFVSGEFAGESFERDWRTLAGEIDLHEMPGDHFTVVKQHVDVLAKSLVSCLDDVQRRAGR